MGMMKARQISSGRYPIKYGIDFTVAEGTQVSTVGTAIKFRGGTTMGYDHATRGGIRIVSTRDDEYAHGLAIEDTITCAKEARKGAFYMYAERASTEATTTWGGGQDQLMNLTLRNYSDSSSVGLGMRGFDLNIRQRSSAKCGDMYGMLVTVETDSGTDTTGSTYAGRFVIKHNGVHSGSGNQFALEAACESQTADQPTESGLLRLEKQSNSNTLDTKYGMYIDNNAAAKVITNAIYFAGTITYSLAYDENDGSQGFTAGAALTQSGNIDGYIKIRDVETGQDLYVNCYDAAPA